MIAGTMTLDFAMQKDGGLDESLRTFTDRLEHILEKYPDASIDSVTVHKGGGLSIKLHLPDSEP